MHVLYFGVGSAHEGIPSGGSGCSMHGALATKELWGLGAADSAQGIMGIAGRAMYLWRAFIRLANKELANAFMHYMNGVTHRGSHFGSAVCSGIRYATTHQECELAWCAALL